LKRRIESNPRLENLLAGWLIVGLIVVILAIIMGLGFLLNKVFGQAGVITEIVLIVVAIMSVLFYTWDDV
jgi:hypothetical protein